jgi:3-oxoacyl-[acyl-carrier protein] reductase
MELNGKTAIVTGGNSGIGLAISTALAGVGMNILIAGRREHPNESVARELAQRHGVRTDACAADVSQEADCERLVQQAVDRFGSIHLLINNAGVAGGDRIEKTSTADFDRVLKTNLYGTFWCSRAVYPRLRMNSGSPRGVIINICSVAGKQAWSGSGTYSASKFGVLALTQALADEGKEHDIKAAAVCPAMVATPMTGVSGPDYLQPEECAETVLYLLRLSPAAWPTEIVLERKGAD